MIKQTQKDNSMSKICSLCLKEILDSEDFIIVDDAIRHKTCSDEFEKDLKELEDIYNETKPEDI